MVHHQDEIDEEQYLEERDLEEWRRWLRRRRRRSPYTMWLIWIGFAIGLGLLAFALGVFNDIVVAHKFQPYPWQLLIGMAALGAGIFAVMEVQIQRIDNAIATVKLSVRKSTEQAEATAAAVAAMAAANTEALATVAANLAKLTDTVELLARKIDRLVAEKELENEVGAHEHNGTPQPQVPRLDDHR